MIDLLKFSKALAAELQTATGITTLTEGNAELKDGEFSDVLILTLGGETEVVQLNSTYRVQYLLGYVYQPESMTTSALESKREEIMQDVAGYIEGISRYSEIGGAVILQADVSPWEVNYETQETTYSIPISVVVQF